MAYLRSTAIHRRSPSDRARSWRWAGSQTSYRLISDSCDLRRLSAGFSRRWPEAIAAGDVQRSRRVLATPDTGEAEMIARGAIWLHGGPGELPVARLAAWRPVRNDAVVPIEPECPAVLLEVLRCKRAACSLCNEKALL